MQTARSAISASSTAKSALQDSPLKQTVTRGGSYGTWETKTIRTGRGWGISVHNADTGGEGNSCWYKIDNGSQVTTPAGTNTVQKWFTTNFQVYWWSPTSNVVYIPC